MSLTDGDFAFGVSGEAVMPAGVPDKNQEAMEALGVLGFTSSEAAAVLKTIDTAEMSIEDIVREALRRSIK